MNDPSLLVLHHLCTNRQRASNAGNQYRRPNTLTLSRAYTSSQLTALIETDPFIRPPVQDEWRDPTWPEVSVSLLTYNQRELIGRAIDSILAQRVNFRYEIIIGDDCSDDRTQEVLLDYQRRFPDRIVLVLHPRRYDNVAGRINNMTNLLSCRGKYTAMLDGDDYWTDPNKLQTQYDLLEAHPEIVMSTHDSEVVIFDAEDRELRRVLSSERVPYSSVNRLHTHAQFTADRSVFFHNSSVVFRTRIFGELPADFFDVIAADHYLMLLVSERGLVHYSPAVRSVYNKYVAGFTRNPAYSNFASRRRRQLDLMLYEKRFPAIRKQRSYRARYASISLRLALEAISRKKALQTVLPNVCRVLFNDPHLLSAVVGQRLRRIFGR